MGHFCLELFGGGVGGQAQDVAPVDAREAAGSRDEQEAQRPHAAEQAGVGALARAGLGLRQGVELEAAGDIMGEDAELLPGAVGTVVAGGHDVEGELPPELPEDLLLGPPPGRETRQSTSVDSTPAAAPGRGAAGHAGGGPAARASARGAASPGGAA